MSCTSTPQARGGLRCARKASESALRAFAQVNPITVCANPTVRALTNGSDAANALLGTAD